MTGPVTTHPNTGLVEALERFLGEAGRVADEEVNRGGPPPSARALAQSLAALPTCLDADTAARRAAAANAYLVSALGHRRRRSSRAVGETQATAGSSTDASPDTDASPSSPEARERWGRPLDADVLISTGVVGMFLDRTDLDLKAVARDLANFLAGPPIDIWDYAILDGSLATDEPIPVVDGWELVTPTAEQLRLLLPVPATAAYQPDRPFDADDYSGLTMLRRIDLDALPHYRPVVHWEVLYSLALNRPAHLLWQPLIALSLYANPVLKLWGRYQIEPGRRADKLFDSVQWEIWTPDGETEIERPQTGAFGWDIDVSMLRRFLAELKPLIAKALRNKKSGTRLRRCAEHFLIAGEEAHDEGEVLTELNADAVLHYVIALEGLLAGDDPVRGEFTRKVSQRAAVLAGRNDAERLEFERLVHEAYGARSIYAHGSTPTKEIDLPKLRRIVRRCLLTRLIIGDPTAEGPLHKVTDSSLLSHETLDRRIRQPFDEFTQRVLIG